MYPSDPPDDFDRDPCVWHWYKDPADIPPGTSTATGSSGRMGAERPDAGAVREALGETLGERPGAGSAATRFRAAPRARPSWSRARGSGWVLRRDPPGRAVVRPASGRVRGRRAPRWRRGSRSPAPLRFEPAGRALRKRRVPDGPRRGHLGRAAGPAARAYAAARGRLLGRARRGARPHPFDRASRTSLASRGPATTRRSRPASCGRRSSTGSASRCRRSRRACAGCGSTARRRSSARRSSTATSGSAT